MGWRVGSWCAFRLREIGHPRTDAWHSTAVGTSDTARVGPVDAIRGRIWSRRGLYAPRPAQRTRCSAQTRTQPCLDQLLAFSLRDCTKSSGTKAGAGPMKPRSVTKWLRCRSGNTSGFAQATTSTADRFSATVARFNDPDRSRARRSGECDSDDRPRFSPSFGD